MTCQETQRKIMSFIDRRLSKAETQGFIEHVSSCSECMDELEINYIMTAAMRELDEGVEGETDFKKALLEELDERYEELELENERINLLLMAVFALMLVGLFVFFYWFFF